MSSSDLVRRAREIGGFSPEAELCSLMADEIERLRAALVVIYRAHEKVLDEGDAWFITDDTTVGYYICSVLGAPPDEKK